MSHFCTSFGISLTLHPEREDLREDEADGILGPV